MFTESDLQSIASGAVAYEVRHIMEAAKQWNLLDGKPACGDLRTLVLEAFLLHYRNLKEFLLDEPGKDDVSARHYSNKWTLTIRDWSDYVGDPNVTYDNKPLTEKTRLDKQLAHITSFREWARRRGLKPWPVGIMYAVVRSNFLKFLNSLETARRPWFAEAERVFTAIIPGDTAGSTESSKTTSSFP